MTEIEAIESSIKLWEWLLDHPRQGKEDSPYWDDIQDMAGNCPCCEYYYDLGCGGCPGNYAKPCFAGWYWFWKGYSLEWTRRYAADQILDMLRERQKQLEGGVNET